ncbi:tetratricopeptide repeat protein 28-like [Stylophora pistillata]|uniref:tetratricopeptide repeat protein 28-like n=1 Tax=Stylophora pistillata TaxID=50429 RepID=UPI000C0549E3|nr:tetratricopeptide repeat protein 28-like [Stylophora pistillata]
MSDISNIRVRAKLVVLSCCHSGRRLIKAEGVIGIATTFLASGARSELATRWAIDDEATEQLRKHFYQHRDRGESASESLHQAQEVAQKQRLQQNFPVGPTYAGGRREEPTPMEKNDRDNEHKNN